MYIYKDYTYTIITRADDAATRQRNNVRTVRHSGEVVFPDSIICERVFICTPAASSEIFGPGTRLIIHKPPLGPTVPTTDSLESIFLYRCI